MWGCTKPTNVDIMQRLQNKVLRNIVDARWFVRNSDLHRDLEVDVDKSRDLRRNMKKGSISTKMLRPYSYWTTRA
jgi:hypothetical protein